MTDPVTLDYINQKMIKKLNIDGRLRYELESRVRDALDTFGNCQNYDGYIRDRGNYAIHVIPMNNRVLDDCYWIKTYDSEIVDNHMKLRDHIFSIAELNDPDYVTEIPLVEDHRYFDKTVHIVHKTFREADF